MKKYVIIFSLVGLLITNVSFALSGCTYSLATNYDSLATVDDGSCTFVLIDSANQYDQNLYNGIIVFLASMTITIWFYRRGKA